MRTGPFPYRKYDRDRPGAHDAHATELQEEARALLMEQGVMLLLGEQLPSVRAARVMREGWSPLYVVHGAIEHRSTSKAEDEPLCVASLLGIDVASIVGAGSGEGARMAVFYKLVRDVPCGVLWVQDVKRLSMAPFRWAPASIAECPGTTFMGWEDGMCDDEGLHVRYSGCLLESLSSDQPPDVLPERFSIESSSTGSASHGSMRISRGHASVPLQTGVKMGIMTLGKAHPTREPDAAIVVLDPTAKAVMSGYEGEIKGTIVSYCYYLPDAEGPRNVVVCCKLLDSSQRWCIT